MKNNILNKRPLVSVIIPNYNHEIFLKERIDSVLNQSYDNFEIIILDDCSSDNSLDILNEYKSHENVTHFVVNENNTGNTFIQWNRGMHLSKGEFIWIAESDDFNGRFFLEELLEPLVKDSEVVLSYCQSNKVNNKSEILGNWFNYTYSLDKDLFTKNFTMIGNEFIEHFLIYKNVIPNVSAVVFRRTILEDLIDLKIKNKIKYCGDWLFYIQLIKNKKISYSPKLLNNFRFHESSVIARANKSKNFIEIKNLELFFRHYLIKRLDLNKLYNFKKIKRKNKDLIIKNINDKAFYYMHQKQFIGYILRLRVKLYKFTSSFFDVNKFIS